MIYINRPGVGEQLARMAGTMFAPWDVSIARFKGDELLGGVVYRDFTHAAIQMHVASIHPTWLSPDMLWMVFHYPFIQLNICKAFAPIPSYNLKSIAFASKLGFKEEARIKNVFPDGDLLVLSMEKQDCKWLKIKPKALTAGASVHGQQERRPAAS